MDAAALDVEVVVADFVAGVDVVKAADLGQPGQAGAHGQAEALQHAVLLDPFEVFRAWPDQTHLAAQDIDDLGQLIKPRPSQKPPDASHTGVIPPRGCEGRARRRAATHCAELVKREDPSVLAGAVLCVEDGSRTRELDGQGDEGPRRGGDPQQQEAADHIQRPYEGFLHVALAADEGRQEAGPAVAVEAVGQQAGIKARGKIDVGLELLKEMKQQVEGSFVVDALAEDDFVEFGVVREVLKTLHMEHIGAFATDEEIGLAVGADNDHPASDGVRPAQD